MVRVKSILLLTVLTCLFSVTDACAQLVAFDAQFYQNQYIANPAMAGLENGLRLNLGFRSQWNTIPGSPRDAILTADMSLREKLGMGLSASFDHAGLLTQSKITATFAYHLPINSDQGKLNFGLSANMLREQLAGSNVVGSDNDPDIASFSETPVFDADAGIGFSNERFNLQAALYNLKSIVKDEQLNSVDYSIGYGAVQYRLDFSGYTITPKIAYRRMRNFKSLFDAAAEISPLEDKLKFTGIYHSNQSVSLGFRFLYESKFELMGMYSTAGKFFKSYSYGTFEVGLKVAFVNQGNWY